MVHTVKKATGWIAAIGVAAWVVLAVLGATPLDRWLPDDLGKILGLAGLLLFFFVYIPADTMIEDDQRPVRLAAIAPSLGLTYVSDDASGLPSSSLRYLVPGSPKYVMIGSHDGRQLVACLGSHSDSEGATDYMWCAMAELPTTLPDTGIQVRKSEILACKDWPPKSGWVRLRRPGVTSVHAAIVADARMRDWLQMVGSGCHFHIHNRWVMCKGPKVLLSSSPDGLRQVVEMGKGFVDLLPRTTRWSQNAADTGLEGSSP